MDFALSADQRLVQEMVREFAQKELKPMAATIDQTQQFPWDNLTKMAKLGLLGMIVPEEYGGGGMDFVSLAVAIEEISRVCASTGVITAVNNSLVAYPILTFGNEEQKRAYLPLLCSGQKVGAFALTEPVAGSDVAGMQSSARRDGGHYVLNGAKRFITNGGEAGVYVVFAYTDPGQRHKGISAFIVERGYPGFTVGKHEETMGIRASANCELVFEDCKVPVENLLGREGEGFKIAMHTLDVSRIDIGAQAVGLAQGCLDEALRYSRERRQFGEPIANFQFIQGMLAQMATSIEAARLLVYRAAWLKDSGAKRFSVEASMAKLFASEVAVECARKAVQIHGGYGYSREFAVERLYRDAKVMEIYEGTSQIQSLVIARGLLGA
ncbi:MAG: acyl-CoA dehydrogenase [Candidatus Oleimicrobiaceae bacterium]